MKYKSNKDDTKEDIKQYVFYCYNRTILDKFETDECDICNHNETNDGHEIDNDDLDIRFYTKRKFDAYLRPSTREHFDGMNGIYALVNLCLWNEMDIKYKNLDDDECVEDASDDELICYVDGNEVNGFDYLSKNNIHLNFVEDGCTDSGVWETD